MEALIQRAAAMIGCGADVRDVRAMLVAETEDEGLAFLLLTAARLLAKEPE
jgi:hypothetical protein